MKTREIQRASYPIRLTYDAMSMVGSYLETKNQWELASTNLMVNQLRTASGPNKTKTTMLDIGANYGLYSIIAACHVPNCRVYAFECNPAVINLLKDNAALNSTSIDQAGSRITILDKAVSNQNGSSPFLIRTDNGHGTLDINREDPDSPPRDFIKVSTIDGDWMVQNLDFEIIDYCKIDVEGAEPAVISGLKKLLSEKRIKHIQIEVTATNSAVLDELLDYGYTIVEGKHASMLKLGIEDFHLAAKE